MTEVMATPWRISSEIEFETFCNELADAIGPAIVKNMLDLGKTERDAAMAARDSVAKGFKALVLKVLEAAEARANEAKAEHVSLLKALEEYDRVIAEALKRGDLRFDTLFAEALDKVRMKARSLGIQKDHK